MKVSVSKKIMIAAVAAFAASAPLAAFAAPPKSHSSAKAHKTSTTKAAKEEYTTGTVEAYAAGTRTLKLSTGGEFKLAPSITQTNFKSGDRVTVGWKMENGSRVADKVEMK
jgi:hypothetical protein